MTLSSCDVGLTFPTVIYCFLAEVSLISLSLSIFNVSLSSSVPAEWSLGAGARQPGRQRDRPETRPAPGCRQQGHLGRPVRHGAGRLQPHHRNQIRPLADASFTQRRPEGPAQPARSACSGGSQTPGRSPGELPGGTWSVSDIKLPCQWAEQPAITTSHASVNWQ